MKGGATGLHQLRGDKSIHCVDQKLLRIAAEWLRMVGALILIFFMPIGVAHQTATLLRTGSRNSIVLGQSLQIEEYR